MSYATPETFKPGERWLVHLFDFGERCAIEVYCCEWSPSKKYVKIEFVQSGAERWESNPIRLIERLPDESNDNQAAAVAGTVEEGSKKFWYCIKCGKRLRRNATTPACPKCEQEIKEFTDYEAAQKAEATQVESAAQSEHNGTD